MAGAPTLFSGGGRSVPCRVVGGAVPGMAQVWGMLAVLGPRASGQDPSHGGLCGVPQRSPGTPLPMICLLPELPGMACLDGQAQAPHGWARVRGRHRAGSGAGGGGALVHVFISLSKFEGHASSWTPSVPSPLDDPCWSCVVQPPPKRWPQSSSSFCYVPHLHPHPVSGESWSECELMTLGPVVSCVTSFLRRYMWTPHTSTGPGGGQSGSCGRIVGGRLSQRPQPWPPTRPWLSLVLALLSLELISYMLA